MKTGKLFVISAPSGAGKTTIIQKALAELQTTIDIKRVVTCTSRESRIEEVDGQDYNFFTESEFEQKIKDGYFLEYTKYTGNYYGSPKSILKEIEHGTSFILIIDLAGAKNVFKTAPNATFIWISPPSIDTLRERLVNRQTETDETITNRLQTAEQEISEEESLDIFTYHVINNVLDDAVAEVVGIIRDEIQ